MQIETRNSLFYAAACHNCLGQLEFAKNKLELAKTDSGMKIDKFVSTQLYQNEEISNELKKNLSSIEESVV